MEYPQGPRDLAQALQLRDFAAAQTVLRLSRLPPDAEEQWRAYLLFHAGAAEAALEVYTGVEASGSSKPFGLHRAACLYQLRRYAEAAALAQAGPDCALRTRLLAHCAARLGSSSAGEGRPSYADGESALSEEQLGWEAALLGGKLDDQLSAATLQYGRNEYGPAAATYERLLAQFPELHALRVYAALCHYMSDDWQAAAAHVAAYQAVHPDSALAANLRACCEFRAGGATAALRSLGALPHQLPPEAMPGQQQPVVALVRHNAVVFSGGQGGMQVLPPLVDVIPEARLNLVLLYCRRGDPGRALALLRGMEPATAFEHICKGVACALHGQAAGSEEHVRQAQECFAAVGQSPTEVDTVPGRQCSASALLLGGQPEEALPLLESVAEVCQGDEALSWNLGVARAAAGLWGPAAEALQQVQSLQLLEDPAYAPLLARCLVRAGNPEEAWQLYLRLQQREGAAPGVAHLLHLLGADCFREGAHLWAARAYHALEYLQQQGALAPAAAAGVWEGKRAALAAALREVVEGREEAAQLIPELLGMLRGSGNPQAHVVAASVRNWAREHAPAVLGDATLP